MEPQKFNMFMEMVRDIKSKCTQENFREQYYKVSHSQEPNGIFYNMDEFREFDDELKNKNINIDEV